MKAKLLLNVRQSLPKMFYLEFSHAGHFTPLCFFVLSAKKASLEMKEQITRAEPHSHRATSVLRFVLGQ